MDRIGNGYTKIIVFLIFFIAIELLFLYPDIFSRQTKLVDSTVSSGASQIIEICEAESYSPFCYEREIPKLLDYLSIQEVFDVIRQVRAQDNSYQFCHVLAHDLGEREVSKDPDRWFDVIPLNPTDGLCSNGFIHGAAVTRFNKELFSREEINNIIPDIADACEARGEWRPTGLDQAICYHGLGHVLVHLTDADLKSSLDICDTVAIKNDGRTYLQVCEEGVFMQIFQPLEPEDFALIDRLDLKPSKETHTEFCDYYGRDVEEWSACHREGWPLYREEIRTAKGIINFCSNSPSERQKRNCYATVLSINGRGSLGDAPGMAMICNNLPLEQQKQCYAIGAGTTIEEDRNKATESVAFCARALIEEVENYCYEYLLQTASFNFNQNSPEIRALCEALPSPWQNRCKGNS